MSESHEIQELPPMPASIGRQRVLRELSADPAKQYQLWLLLKHVCENDLAPEGVDKNMIGNLALNLEPVSAADFKAIQ